MKMYMKVLEELGEEKIIKLLSQNLEYCTDLFSNRNDKAECKGNCTKCWDEFLREEV